MKENNIPTITPEELEAIRKEVEAMVLIPINVDANYDNEKEVSTLIITPIRQEGTEEAASHFGKAAQNLEESLKILMGTDAEGRQDYTIDTTAYSFEARIPKSLCYPHAILDRVLPSLLLFSNRVALETGAGYQLCCGGNRVYVGIKGRTNEGYLVLDIQDMYEKVDWHSLKVKEILQSLGTIYGPIAYNVHPNKIEIGVKGVEGQFDIERLCHVLTTTFNDNLTDEEK